MFTALFWRDTAERVISTMAQAGIGVIGSDIFVPNAIDSWVQGATVVGIAGLAALLKCLAATRIGDPESASLSREVD